MPSAKPIQLRLSEPIRAALDEHCAARGIEISAFVRDAICRELGRPDLVETMRSRGQPRKEPSAPAMSKPHRKGSP